MKTKHLIVSGPQPNWNSEVASNLLQLVPYKFTTRLNHEINGFALARFKELPYLSLILVDGCKDQIEIVGLAKSIGLFTKAAIIFTCSKPCASLKQDDRFNVIELG